MIPIPPVASVSLAYLAIVISAVAIGIMLTLSKK